MYPPADPELGVDGVEEVIEDGEERGGGDEEGGGGSEEGDGGDEERE